MNLQNDPQSFALMKFGIGQPVRRTEDPMLVRGEGCYTDDIKLTGEAYAVMVRSRIAHGVIKGVDTTAARNMPGVLGVYTGADLAAYGTLKCIVPFNNRDGTPMKRPPRPALATDKVRFVGDPVAFVVADTVLHAKDAAEAVEVEIDALPAVVRPEEASRPGAPLIHDEAPGNVALDYHFGDSEKLAAAFDRAAHVTRLKLSNSRVVVNAMEPRAAIGIHDPASGRRQYQE
jgi:carbon-monoxide dehydrogenase large subunit